MLGRVPAGRIRSAVLQEAAHVTSTHSNSMFSCGQIIEKQSPTYLEQLYQNQNRKLFACVLCAITALCVMFSCHSPVILSIFITALCGSFFFFLQLSKKKRVFLFSFSFSVSAIIFICVGLCSFFVSFLRVQFFCILYFFLIFTIKSDCAVA